ncbi:TPA: hypothetical protein ACYHS5_001436 [Vibrio cholerae]
MSQRYKYVDDSKQLVAVFCAGDVEYLTHSDVPSGVIIEPWWTEQDQAAYELAEKILVERRWRELEIKQVANRLDQLRNDERYEMVTYTGDYTAAEFNAYRAALVSYGDHIHESSVRPSIEAVAQQLRSRSEASEGTLREVAR